MFRSISLLLFAFVAFTGYSQELFIMTEPASTVPRKSVVPRVYTQWYKERDKLRALASLGFYYGLTKDIMIRVSASTSNHHGKFLPLDIIGHTHVGNQTRYYTQTTAKGRFYSFIFSGINLYGQYRFYSKDEDKKHFRLASYVEYSTSRSAHDEAEPDLMDDNAGFGFGLIATYLKNRKAISFSTGYIIPQDYQELNNNVFQRIDYGHAQKFSLSFGYLLSPKEYVSYKQPNTNLYLEIVGKNVRAMTFTQDNASIPLRSPAHRSSFYLDLYPGVQRIINSNSRIEFAIGLPFVNQSYAHFYPTYVFTFRHYFFL